MTSVGPYNQSYDLSFMYSIPELRSVESVNLNTTSNSLLDIINSHEDFRKFRYILNLSGMANKYSDPQANFTIFVPSDATLSKIPEEIFINMDISLARSIIKSSTLKRRISSKILEYSPADYFITTDPINKLFVTNNNRITMINKYINVIHKDQEADNGLLHVIDGLIWPITI